MRFAPLAALFAAGTALASPGPQPVAPPPPAPPAADIRYPGVIDLAVDASDVGRRIVHVREGLPVAAGPLVLRYPDWVPGAHAPRGSADHLAGLALTAGGKRLAWRRDALDPFAFRVEVPAGATRLDIAFDVLTPTDAKQGRVTIDDAIAHLQPWSLLLYPAGHFARDIAVAARVTVPAGWTLATALDVAGQDGATTRFRDTDLETLVDSPLFAGAYAKRFTVAAGAHPVHLDLFAEAPDGLNAAAANLDQVGAMVVQADRLFGGGRPFDHYDLLVGLSETIGGIGREHQRSTEIVTRPDLFTAWDRAVAGRTTLSHEYVHAWNGKAKRGADSWTPDFNTPIGGSLLWVYEGQTQYWGVVLAARAGLTTPEQARDTFAGWAATYQAQAGRAWRPLADTGFDPVIAARRPEPWGSWQRGEDYYSEGALIWLDADTRLRAGGKASLDDFARNFFGRADGDMATRTYTLDDVVAALGRAGPGDWAGFLRARVEALAPPPLDGLSRGGWRLAWGATPSDAQRGNDAVARRSDFTFSVGFVVDAKDSTLAAVQWDGPAYKAGLTAGTQLIAVGGAPYTPELLAQAIAAAKGGTAPVELIVKAGGHLGTVSLDWHGGLRYPRLERVPGTPDLLSAILAPRP